MNKNINIVLCGVGGQGTVLASKLIAAAAMKKNIPVMSAETIGMAQRGGSVISHIRMGEGLYAPMIARGTADVIIGFEPGETVRMLPYLKEGGQVVVSRRAIMPVTATLSGTPYDGNEMIEYLKKYIPRLLIVDTEQACRDIGSSKVLNILLLGAAVHSGSIGLDAADIKEAILGRLPERFHELNFRALAYVRELSPDYLSAG
ncbi:MAG: indolepyruvate oxidoreductase subunit beta [Lachnospiraceae bacterium]